MLYVFYSTPTFYFPSFLTSISCFVLFTFDIFLRVTAVMKVGHKKAEALNKTFFQLLDLFLMIICKWVWLSTSKHKYSCYKLNLICLLSNIFQLLWAKEQLKASFQLVYNLFCGTSDEHNWQGVAKLQVKNMKSKETKKTFYFIIFHLILYSFRL